MLTYAKVLEVFQDYREEDKSCEVLLSNRGYLVVDWESRSDTWVTAQICETPDFLLDVLRSCYEEYQSFLLSERGKRDLTDGEEQEIYRMGEGLASRCQPA